MSGDNVNASMMRSDSASYARLNPDRVDLDQTSSGNGHRAPTGATAYLDAYLALARGEIVGAQSWPLELTECTEVTVFTGETKERRTHGG